jgi:nucleotide-binding universal stress UspA family protein
MSEIANNILIPVDFNETSLVAIEQSYNLARFLNLSLVLLYVNEEPSFIRGLFSDDEFEKRKDLILARLNELAKKAETEAGVTIKSMVTEGRIYEEISRIAELLQSKFIVMGTRGSIDDKKIIGANTSRVIRSAPCPVITINSKHNHNGCRSILLPLDLTQETRQKVSKAIEMAQLFNAKIKVMSALWSKHNVVIHNQLLRQLKQVQDFITDAGVNCSAELVESTGSEKSLVPIILRYAREQGDIDLLIIMTQQELAIVEFFVSSSAQEVIRTSEIPVMSIVPKELGFTSIMS